MPPQKTEQQTTQRRPLVQVVLDNMTGTDLVTTNRLILPPPKTAADQGQQQEIYCLTIS